LNAQIIHCPQCLSTGVLVGLDQISCNIYVDCFAQTQLKSFHKKNNSVEACDKIRPGNENYPKLVKGGS